MKTNPVYTIALVTLGCSKNQVDSEFLAGKLKKRGVKASHQFVEGQTDAVIINTCGFILDAKEESIQTILQYLEMKKEGLLSQVFVMGCLTERYRKEVASELPGIDGIYGVHEQDKIVDDITGRLRDELLGERVLTTPSHYAYLKIAEGCDRTCSFCAIPGIRGKNISRPIEELVAEAENLAGRGVKELILIAQDLTYYGIDLYGRQRLADLLRALEEVKGIEWLRLHYTFPAQFPLDVLDIIRKSDKVCSYLDIPLQHINSRILSSMRRNIDGDKTRELVRTIREKVPGIAVRTTLITGYPGETEKEFEELKAFVEESRFERLGVFPYSHEEDTPAYQLQDDIAEETKEQRMEALMEIQQQISLENNQSLVGKALKVIIDREEGDYFVGRSEFDSPEVDNEILIARNKDIRVGEFYQAKITQADFFDIYAE